MSGRLIRNIIFLFIINIVVKPVWTFGIDIPAQNHLGQVFFGQYASLLSLSLIFQIILDLGLQTYQSRQVGSIAASMNWLLPNALMAKSGLALLYFLILMGCGWLLNYNPLQLRWLFFLGISQVANSLMLYLRAGISSMHYYAVDSVISVIDKLVVILICGSILYQWIDIPFRVEHLVYGHIAGYSISALICFIFIHRHTELQWNQIRWKRIKSVLKVSAPYALLILTMAVFFRIDIVILEKLNTHYAPQEAGHYWEAFRLLDMLNNFTGILFAGLYLPMVMRHKKNKAVLLRLTHTGLNILLPVSITICVLIYFFHHQIMNLLYSPQSPEDSRLLFIMMLSFPFYSLNYIYSTLLSGMGQVRSQIYHALISSLIIIIGNLLFSRAYGAVATAIISMIGHSVFFTLNYYKARRVLQLHSLPERFIIKYLLFTLSVLICCYILYANEIALLYSIGLLTASSVAGLFIFRIIGIKDITSMLKEKD